MKTLFKRLRSLVALLLAVVLIGCASGPKEVFHSFTCNGRNDVNKWLETTDLLAYSYGDQYRMVRRSMDDPSEKAWLQKNGETSLSGCLNVGGAMPVGEFLYVKWRIKATGEIFEDRVDLRERLPKNMMNHKLTFSINEKQLYLFVVTPLPRNPKDEKYTVPKYPQVNFYKPTHLTWLSAHAMTYEIYPELEPYPKPTHLTSEQIEKCLRLEIACAADKPKK
jgi:hypothetical protein